MTTTNPINHTYSGDLRSGSRECTPFCVSTSATIITAATATTTIATVTTSTVSNFFQSESQQLLQSA